MNDEIISSIVCIAKKEHQYIEEFVKYHLALGFNKIFLYDNEDEPTYKEILKNYLDKVYVMHYPGNNFEKGVQYKVLDDFVVNILKNPGNNSFFKITHVAHIDIDEFIVLKKHTCINDFIKEYIKDDCEGIAINWKFFGSNNLIENTFEPVTLRFTKCQKIADKHIKTLFSIKNFKHFNTVHDVKLFQGHIKLTNGIVVNNPGHDHKIDISVIQLNHYKSKTYEEFKSIRQRGRADLKNQLNENIDENFKCYDKNEVEDLWAFNFYKKNRQELIVQEQMEYE